MKSRLLVVLFVALCLANTVRAGDDDGEEGEEKPAKKEKGGKVPGNFHPEGLPPLPVAPLSVDAAALEEDDKEFDSFQPKSVKGTESVQALNGALAKARALLTKMRDDLEGEKVWTKNVYDIIQNYQYKYLRTVKDVRDRQSKVKKMAKLVRMLKASTLHAGVQQELSRASKALEELVERSGKKGGEGYRRIADRMSRLRKTLQSLPAPRALHTETTRKMKKILSATLPPQTSDAVRNLMRDSENNFPEPKESKDEDDEEEEKPKKQAGKKAAGKKKAGKKLAKKSDDDDE
jgi:hypothetical protein